MSFPQTRHTLIQRIVTQGDEKDWQEFLADYWGPVCRFALHQGNPRVEDAEDIASMVFQALIQNQLLIRWVGDRAAKLRTLLCSVTRNVLANRARVNAGRQRLLREYKKDHDDRLAFPLVASLEVPVDQVDAFHAAWVEDLLQHAVDALLEECHQAGKGDYFRVLHGRVCEDMSIPAIAQSLDVNVSTAENYYKAIRQRLSRKLEDLVRAHVTRYCPDDESEAEFSAEWAKLGDFLKDHGGLEQTIRRAYELKIPSLGINFSSHLQGLVNKPS